MELLMRRKAWLAVAILVAAFLPQPGRAQDVAQTGHLSEFIDSLQLGWRPEPHEMEPFNQPAAMNGYSILNYYQTDAIAMRRSAGSFNGGELDWSVGPRIVLGRGLSDRDAFEIGYFAQYQMNGNVFVPGGAGFNVNNRADYRSELNSAELNYRHWFTPELSVLAGFRYLNWHENLNTAFDTASPLPPGTVNQVYHTSNNLFGLQTGGDWKHCFNDKFGIELGAKAGVYGTHVEMDGTVNVPGIGILSTNANSSRASFVGELGLIGTYKVTTYLNARAGYQVMWVEGIALAPDQVTPANFLGAPSVNNRGSVFLHGAVLGLELRW
jgi:hypothetical protein